jgi:hypothetical protein
MALLSKGIKLACMRFVGGAEHTLTFSDKDIVIVFASDSHTPYGNIEMIPVEYLIGALVVDDNDAVLGTVTNVIGNKVDATNNTSYDCSKLAEDIVSELTEGVEDPLENLQEIAELGNNAPEKVDITVLSDEAKKSMDGLRDTAQDLAFKFLYEKEQFNKLAKLTGSCGWKVKLPDGTRADFTATPSVKLDGVGVGAALTYTLTLSVESLIEFA